MHTHQFTGPGFCARLAAFAALLLLTLGLAPAARATPITVIASFNVTNGQQPMCGVTFDAAGNMYGTTYRGDSTLGSTNQDGVVWKIAHGTNTITDLVQFTGNGFVPANPYGNVAVDANGNVYGTVSSGSVNGNSGSGGVFEIAAGSGTLTDRGDFSVGGNPGWHPVAGVARDAAGNLFGTTQYGSTNNSGTIWEIPAGGTLTTIASFLGTVPNGSVPLDGVTLDSQGNLYGTCQQGGTSEFGGAGTVWELPHGSHTVVTLAEFNQTNGYAPTGDVAVDAAGNVYGTTTGGGSTSRNAGVVWEVVAGTNTVTDLGTFAGSIGANTVDGYTPSGNVVLDGAGNLFGTTTGGGTSDFGTVWEIPKNGTLTTIASFSGANGAAPYGDVMLDAQGNLFGTTASGGPANAGVVWEMVGVGVPVGVGGGTPVPTALTLTPNPAFPDTTINGTVTFSQSVPAGTSVAITRNGSTSLGSIATPTTGTSLAFTLPLPGYLNGSYTIGATLNGQTASQTLTVISDPNKPVPVSLVFSPSPALPGAAITGTVTLSGPAPAGGLSVEIFENGTDLGTVTVAAGASTGLFGQTLTAGTYAYAAVENGVQVTATLTVSSTIPAAGHTHLLWNNTDGRVMLWSIAADGTFTLNGFGPYTDGAPQNKWTATAVATGADGVSHLLWNNTDGRVMLWTVDDAGNFTLAGYGPYTDGAAQNKWSATAVSVGPGNAVHLLWSNTDHRAMLWNVASDFTFTLAGYGPYTDNAPQNLWSATALATGPDGDSHILWNNTDNRVMLWNVASDFTFTLAGFGPYTDGAPQNRWNASGLSVGPDNVQHILWTNTDRRAMFWNVDSSFGFTLAGFGPYTDNAPGNLWSAAAVATGPDGMSHLLWNNTDNRAMLWGVDSAFNFTVAGYGPYTDNAPGNLWSATAVSAGP